MSSQDVWLERRSSGRVPAGEPVTVTLMPRMRTTKRCQSGATAIALRPPIATAARWKGSRRRIETEASATVPWNRAFRRKPSRVGTMR